MNPARNTGVSRAGNRVQGRARRRVAALPAVLLPLLGGCAAPDSINPVDWWHDLEGGAIADARPPPPNVDAPYPKLSTVPPKPPPPDPAALQKAATALLSDRGAAQYAASVQPIPALPPPHRPAAAPAAAGDDSQPNAALQAANAPPAPAAPGAAAPAAAQASASASGLAAPDPDLPNPPAAPPPPPVLAGVNVPAVTAPTPLPVAPPPTPKPPPPPGPPVGIAFPHGSGLLPEDALATLKSLAAQRGARAIAVTGFGEATSDDPAAQAAALPLALDRARAVAAALGAFGVPGSALRLVALPAGGGAVARVVN
jgi:outer membrane protein OmpA-like peptidoglycan-associated protein